MLFLLKSIDLFDYKPFFIISKRERNSKYHKYCETLYVVYDFKCHEMNATYDYIMELYIIVMKYLFTHSNNDLLHNYYCYIRKRHAKTKHFCNLCDFAY